MWIVRHTVEFLLIYKDLVGILLQIVLLFAVQQVRAADAQAEAAHIQAEIGRQQLKVVSGQLETAKAQSEEEIRQGVMASRPNLRFRDADPGFTTSPVVIRNDGPGVAYRTNWRFVSPENPSLENRICEIGTLEVGQEMAIPWGFDKEYPRLQTRLIDEHGVRVECMDVTGRLYTTTLKIDQQNLFVVESEQVLPDNPVRDRVSRQESRSLTDRRESDG
jgi:hypothetical protein